jgi:hypothetical protein
VTWATVNGMAADALPAPAVAQPVKPDATANEPAAAVFWKKSLLCMSTFVVLINSLFL